MDENRCHKHFCFQKIEILEQLKLILGAFLVWCSKIIELGFNEKFIRTWEYYFDYCAAGFKTHTLGNYQVPLYTITISTQLTLGFYLTLGLDLQKFIIHEQHFSQKNSRS